MISPNEKLDYALNYLADHITNNNELFVVKHSITQKTKLQFQDDEILNVLNKLVKDGLVSVSNSQKNGTIDEGKKYYSITFEGEILISSGGYKRKSCVNTVNFTAKIIEALFLVIGAIGAVYYARLSYLETTSQDTLKQTNKVLERTIFRQDSIIKNK